MKVRFYGLNLLLSLGFVGCGFESTKQDANSGNFADNGDSPAVVLVPPVTGSSSSALSQPSTPNSKPTATSKSELNEAAPLKDIFRSAGSGDVDAVKKLLASGSKINAKDKSGKTPLLWAVRSQKHEIVSLLLARGANPNLADNSDLTPLFWAVRSRRPEIVNVLLSRGVDIDHKDKRGKTALDYAKDETIIAILRRHASEKQ